jgi:CheY-like chemotaxis protein
MARLLIVDDERSIRDALVQVFEYEGHEVRGAADGPAGLAAAAELPSGVCVTMPASVSSGWMSTVVLRALG